jgi:hypothetical protein
MRNPTTWMRNSAKDRDSGGKKNRNLGNEKLNESNKKQSGKQQQQT